MTANESVVFGLLVALVSPAGLYAQSEGQNVTLVNTTTGELATANPDGTQETLPYVVPADQELCVKDIAWEVRGAPGEDVSFWLNNTNIDGVSFYQLWAAHPTLSSLGRASGLASFQAGPQITVNGGLSFAASTGVESALITVYGIQRPLSAAGGATATHC